MMNDFKYKELKRLMIQYYQNNDIFVELQGNVKTRHRIKKAKLFRRTKSNNWGLGGKYEVERMWIKW